MPTGSLPSKYLRQWTRCPPLYRDETYGKFGSEVHFLKTGTREQNLATRPNVPLHSHLDLDTMSATVSQTLKWGAQELKSLSVADVYPHSLSSASSSKVYVGSTGISEGDDTIKDDLVQPPHDTWTWSYISQGCGKLTVHSISG